MFKKHTSNHFKECHFQDFGNLDLSWVSSVSFLFQISWTDKLTSAILFLQDKKLSCQSPSHMYKSDQRKKMEKKNYADSSKTSGTDG